MEPDVTTFLLRLPVYLPFWQYIDFAILIIFLVFYRSLKKEKSDTIPASIFQSQNLLL
jgi:hypothetical protein